MRQFAAYSFFYIVFLLFIILLFFIFVFFLLFFEKKKINKFETICGKMPHIVLIFYRKMLKSIVF